VIVAGEEIRKPNFGRAEPGSSSFVRVRRDARAVARKTHFVRTPRFGMAGSRRFQGYPRLDPAGQSY
jgi:hypothetical protein